MNESMPKQIEVEWSKHFRIIPSVYPPINFFEELVDSSEMESIWYIEGLTNERLREQVGDIFLVKPEDRVSGEGSSVVMAAFTHIGKQTRFSDGSYGVYYAGGTLEIAVRETVFHRERFLRTTLEPAGQIDMRVYVGKVSKKLHDVRTQKYSNLYDRDNYVVSQEFGKELREKNSWGLIYKSVRHDGGECVAIFRPPAITIPIQASHLSYVWNGKKITDVYQKSEIMFQFN